jgi:hypothetical protein
VSRAADDAASRLAIDEGEIVPNTTNSPQRDRSHIAPVTTREELFFLLERASELEHGLACIYLFAAYSLKNDASEGGLTETQATMVRGWKRHLAQVAVEEMLHLAQTGLCPDFFLRGCSTPNSQKR